MDEETNPLNDLDPDNPFGTPEGDLLTPIVFTGYCLEPNLVICPVCSAIVPGQQNYVQAHTDWHIAAGKRVDTAGMGFGLGSLFGGGGAL